MAHYGTLRDYRFSDKDADDIRGSDVYGTNDEKLGDIDDVIFDHTTGVIRYVVVDAGGWLASELFIVPADRLRPSEKHENDFQVNLTKDQIKQFPAYDESATSDRDRWADYEKRYEELWDESPVLHRKDAPDRIITAPHEEEGAVTGTASQGSSRLGDRWNEFESRLRRDRAKIVGICGVCGTGPSSATTDVDRQRKVG